MSPTQETKAFPPVQRQLIVFDFDWSLADQDSDRWVLEVLAPRLRKKMKDLQKDVQWTDLVAMTLKDLHELGGTREQIEEALRVMPFHPAMVRGVSALKSRGKTTFFCLSNANIIYITTILKAKGLDNLFDEIVTNPAEWHESGLLQLRRRIDPSGPQHGCQVGCSPNMCKGQCATCGHGDPNVMPWHSITGIYIRAAVDWTTFFRHGRCVGDELDAFLTKHQPDFDRVIYVGDGANDFCPVLRMRKQDVVFCRRYRGLYNLIKEYEEEGRLHPSVEYWTGAWEVEALLDQL